eukprot:CAMPEP_0183415172 /NCGR_PEP_ID=MMETSP0370-20130417/22908_1 /TAXON_ID=268820 /ORGANISM="Peridinium aciculiferum, Strain PAER-2" /LENGTH=73 /DNA_ID=CAMNT_0025598569 /DNA_START=46 /DNA_END=264 /DNA_ORIENTATION=-
MTCCPSEIEPSAVFSLDGSVVGPSSSLAVGATAVGAATAGVETKAAGRGAAGGLAGTVAFSSMGALFAWAKLA